MLEGRKVNLKTVEKEDYQSLPEWFTNLGLTNDPLSAQQSTTDFEKENDVLGYEEKWFFIEKKDGSRIGFLGTHARAGKWLETLEIGYALNPAERGHGYCIDAMKAAIDDFARLEANAISLHFESAKQHLCTSRVPLRFHRETNSENRISQKLTRPLLMREETPQEWILTWGHWPEVYLHGTLRRE